MLRFAHPRCKSGRSLVTHPDNPKKRPPAAGRGQGYEQPNHYGEETPTRGQIEKGTREGSQGSKESQPGHHARPQDVLDYRGEQVATGIAVAARP